MPWYQKDKIYKGTSKNHNDHSTFALSHSEEGKHDFDFAYQIFSSCNGNLDRSGVDSGTLFHPNVSYFFGFTFT